MADLAKNQIHKVSIEGYSADGAGIARLDGCVVFVSGGIAGELCEIRILKVLKHMAYARVERILKPSPERREPQCPAFRLCGGCDFQHMSYAEELRAKLRRVNDAFERIGALALRCEKITGSERTAAYRNKAQYFISTDGQVGFYRARTHELCAIERCMIQDERANACAAALSEWIRGGGASVYDERTGLGCVRGLMVRCGSGGTHAAVIAACDSLPDEAGLVERLRAACNDLCGVVLNINKKRGNVILGYDNRTLWGAAALIDKMCRLEFEISPNSFYQVNREQAERLYEKAGEYMAPAGKLLLDLYCGTGAIGLTMAAEAERVIGVEIVPPAIENAKKNAARNGVTNAEFICADAGAAAEMLSGRGLEPHGVIVDPPRKGLSAEVIETVKRMAPERVVYVSCDPATLARDLKLFSDQYTPTKCEAFDLFPRCAHVETVVQLVRKDA